ncbi:unnamed protein product, partial [Ectocarpus fasciculatus]
MPASAEITFDSGGVSQQRIVALEQELQYAKENLQTTIEELETTNEELNATNEELIASNEELQSTNEELHSVNEELHTVNAEYQQKITELTQLTDDINNLLSSTQIGTLFVDRSLHVRRFTPAVARVLRVRDADVGRPLDEISRAFDYDALLSDAQHTLDTGEIRQAEIQLSEDQEQHFLLRINPYRLANETIDGLVLTFVDISVLRLTQRELVASTQRFDAFMANSPALKWAVDDEDRFVFMNTTYEEVFGIDAEQCIGRRPSESLEPKTSAAFLRRSRETNTEAREGESVVTFEIELPIGDRHVWFMVTKFAFRDVTGQRMVGGSAIDITSRKAAEAAVQRANDRLELALRGANTGLWDWDLEADVLRFNEVFGTMLGYGPDELPMNLETWHALVHPDDLPDMARRLGDFVNGRTNVYRSPHRLKRRDGDWHWVVDTGEVTERNADGK